MIKPDIVTSNITLNRELRYSSDSLGYSKKSEVRSSLEYISGLSSWIGMLEAGRAAVGKLPFLQPLANSIKEWDKHPVLVIQIACLVLGITDFSLWVQNENRQIGAENLQQLFLFAEGVGIDSVLAAAAPSLGVVFELLQAAVNLHCYMKEESAEAVHQASFYKTLFKFIKTAISAYCFFYALALAYHFTIAMTATKFIMSYLAVSSNAGFVNFYI